MDTLRIEVDPRGPHSPSAQIERAVRFAVASGALREGDRLPSVRALAVDALVNPNTVGKAWRELEREGVLESRPGDGVFVARGAREQCLAARDAELRGQLERLVADALSAGLSREELGRWLERALRRGGGRTNGRASGPGSASHCMTEPGSVRKR
jgi:GntR family transcriptional regulator